MNLRGTHLEIRLPTPPSCNEHVTFIDRFFFHVLVCIIGDGHDDTTGTSNTCFNCTSRVPTQFESGGKENTTTVPYADVFPIDGGVRTVTCLRFCISGDLSFSFTIRGEAIIVKIEGHSGTQDEWIRPRVGCLWDTSTKTNSVVEPVWSEDAHVGLRCKVEGGAVLNGWMRGSAKSEKKGKIPCRCPYGGQRGGSHPE